MERKEALKLLIELETAQGVHIGMWSNEYGREDSCREYLAKMMEIACELQIPFTINLEDYREFDNNHTYELKDRAGYELYVLCQEKLVDCLI